MPRNTQYPPAKALMIYDGECAFCRYWIQHWQWRTGEKLNYAPFQEAAPAFPDIRCEAFAESVHLIEPDGHVYAAAEAVARALGKSPGGRAYFWIYRFVPGACSVSEWAYRLIARRRSLAMWATKMLWGPVPQR